MLIVLIGLLVLFRGGGGTNRQQLDEEWNKTDAFSEQMMQMNNQFSAPAPVPEAPL